MKTINITAIKAVALQVLTGKALSVSRDWNNVGFMSTNLPSGDIQAMASKITERAGTKVSAEDVASLLVPDIDWKGGNAKKVEKAMAQIMGPKTFKHYLKSGLLIHAMRYWLGLTDKWKAQNIDISKKYD